MAALGSNVARGIGEHPDYYKSDAVVDEAHADTEGDMRDPKRIATLFHDQECPDQLAKSLAALWGPTAPTGMMRHILLESVIAQLQDHAYDLLFADNLDRIQKEINWGRQ